MGHYKHCSEEFKRDLLVMGRKRAAASPGSIKNRILGCHRNNRS